MIRRMTFALAETGFIGLEEREREREREREGAGKY